MNIETFEKASRLSKDIIQLERDLHNLEHNTDNSSIQIVIGKDFTVDLYQGNSKEVLELAYKLLKTEFEDAKTEFESL